MSENIIRGCQIFTVQSLKCHIHTLQLCRLLMYSDQWSEAITRFILYDLSMNSRAAVSIVIFGYLNWPLSLKCEVDYQSIIRTTSRLPNVVKGVICWSSKKVCLYSYSKKSILRIWPPIRCSPWIGTIALDLTDGTVPTCFYDYDLQRNPMKWLHFTITTTT